MGFFFVKVIGLLLIMMVKMMMKIIVIMEFCGFHRESYDADVDAGGDIHAAGDGIFIAGDDIYDAGHNTYVDVDENDDD